MGKDWRKGSISVAFSYKNSNVIKEWTGRYFDGETPVPQQVTVCAENGQLILKNADTNEMVRSIDAPSLIVVHTHNQGKRVDFSIRGEAGTRLSLEGRGIKLQLGNHIPQTREALPGMGSKNGLKVSAYLIVFMVCVGAFLWKVHSFVPALLPDSYVNAMGDSTLDIIHAGFGPACVNPEAEAVLDKMVKRVKGDEQFDYPLHVEVVNSEVVNALAAPGARVVIFDGLIKQATSAEEVAGVLGHEIGHVLKKHSLVRLSQTMGLDLMVALLGGSNLGSVSQHLILMSYSREAETEADEVAIALLQNAGISTAGTADFFDRLSKRSSVSEENDLDIPLFLSTHPASNARAQNYQDAAIEAEPLLTDEEWQILLKICANTNSEEEAEPSSEAPEA